MEKISGVYTITNLVTGRVYVGSSMNIKERWYKHRNDLKGNKHRNSYLQNSWNKYGSKCFKFSIVEILNNPIKEELAEYEEAWFQYYKEEGLVYNLRKITWSNLGIKLPPHTEETKIKMRNSSPRKKLSEEAKENLRRIKKGVPLSEEHKKALSLAKKGKKWSEKAREANKGKKLSEEHKRNISKGGMGRVNSEEMKEKIRNTLMGHEVSAETREKLRKAKTGIKQSQETINKKIESRKGYRHSQETIEKIRQSNIEKAKQKKESMNSSL